MNRNKEKSKKKSNKVIAILAAFIQIVLIVALLTVSVLSFGTKLSYFAKLGFNFFAVTSGSMEPTLPVGSLIYVGKYKVEDLKQGDIITFKVKDAESAEVSVVTHRIEEVIKEERLEKIGVEGEEEQEKKYLKYEFVTKGDANTATDARTVPSINILGLYQWHLPYLGYVTNFAQTPVGFISMVIIPAIILIVWEVVSLVLHFKKEIALKSEKEIAKLKKELEEEKQKNKQKKKK
jgi:signal peptidase